jgi:hypothetical protein
MLRPRSIGDRAAVAEVGVMRLSPGSSRGLAAVYDT